MNTTYDQTPYPRLAYGFTHPDRLATLASLHGLEPPPIERSRVLEIGCARGANIIPMAYALPKATFVGIDLSERQIADARQFAAAVDLKNIRLEQIDLANLDDSFGPFDYIIVHGVYSWVPEPARQALMEICGRRLVENGIAIVSFNAYPGCHLRQMVRAMGQFHTRAFDEPRQRVEQMNALMQLLVRFAPDDGSAYKRILRGEADRIARLSEEVVIHDVLEEANYPLYFYEFVEHARTCGLQYICDALPDRRRTKFPPDVIAKLESQYDRIELEQHLDFLDGTSFRRAILCREGQTVGPDALAATEPVPSSIAADDPLNRLLLATPALPLSALPELESSRPEEFVARKERLTASLRCDRPIEKMSLAVLGEVYPLTMRFRELLGAAAARLGRSPTPVDRHELRALLAGGFTVGAVELHSWQPPAVNSVSDRPTASRAARYELSQDWAATTLWHERFAIGEPLARQLVMSLDGETDREAIVARLRTAAPEHAAAIDELSARLELILNDLARAAMLIA